VTVSSPPHTGVEACGGDDFPKRQVRHVQSHEGAQSLSPSLTDEVVPETRMRFLLASSKSAVSYQRR
jgi:hypothetical protein